MIPKVFVVLIALLVKSRLLIATVCSFKRGECVYNIKLEQTPGVCKNDKIQNTINDYAYTETLDNENKNEYFKNLSLLQKYIQSTKNDHEARLKLLETVVSALSSEQSTIPENISIKKQYKQLKQRFGTSLERSENQLLTEIHDEFSVLRRRLAAKRDLLLITQRKYNDTTRRLSDVQTSLIKTNKILVSLENELNTLREDNFILKSKLKNQKERDHGDRLKLENTEQALKSALKNTTRYKDKFKSALYSLKLYKENLNESVLLMNRAFNKYESLSKVIWKNKYELARREKELLECYSGKTSTFCGFEHKNICGYTQEVSTDFFNWTWTKGTTPSGGTGPTRDNTCGSRGGHFMYIEASSKLSGQNAILYSPKFRGLTEQCLEFYFHMYGRSIGTLNVYTRVYGNELSAVWRSYGNQGNLWIKARLNIPEYVARAGYQIAFEGITTRGYQGDIAIDDVSVNDGECPTNDTVKAVKVDVNIPTVEPTKGPMESKIHKRRRRKFKRLKLKLIHKIRQTLNQDKF